MIKSNRKLLVALVTVLLAFVLAMYGRLTADFVQIAIVVNAAFSAANAFEHHKNGKPAA